MSIFTFIARRSTRSRSDTPGLLLCSKAETLPPPWWRAFAFVGTAWRTPVPLISSCFFASWDLSATKLAALTPGVEGETCRVSAGDLELI